MSSTSHSLLSALRGKDSFGTGSHIFAAILTATSFTLRVVQSYLSTPATNVKHVPLHPPAPFPSPVSPTTTRPLTPTRSSDFVDTRANASYTLLSLVLVLITILASAGYTLARAKSKSTVTPHITPQEQEQEQDPPPDIHPKEDEGSSDDTEDREDSSDEEGEDVPIDPEDNADDEGNNVQENGDDNGHASGGNPGDDPDDSSGSSNVEDIPPPQFEPDPWDVLALAFLYIYVITYIVRHGLHKRFVLKVANRLLTSAASIRTKASEFVEHALQQVDARFLWIENVGMSMAMDIVDVGFRNGTREIENTTVVFASKMIMDELRQVSTKPTLIEGLLVLIASQPFQIPSPVPRQVLKLPKMIVPPLPLPAVEVMELPPLPLPTIEEVMELPRPTVEVMELSPLPLPTVEVMELQPLPLPTLEEVMELPPLPLPTVEGAVPPPEPSTFQSKTSSDEIESEFHGVVGLVTVAFLVRRVIKRRRCRKAATQIKQHEPKVEIETETENRDEGGDKDKDKDEREDEGKDEDYSSTAVGEQSSNDVFSDFLDAHEPQENNEVENNEVENNEVEEVQTHQPSDIFDNGFITAQDIDVATDTTETIQEDRPIPPTITVSPSFNVPNTPERAVTYPSGTPSFVRVLRSPTLRQTHREGTESRPTTPPAITILLSAPNTPEPVTVYPNGTPSFVGVLTSSTLRHTRTEGTESRPATPPAITILLSAPNTPNGVFTAQDIDVAMDTTETIQENRPIPPTITVSPSFSVPDTPERAVTYPSGTPSFVRVLTSSTLRHTRTEGTESCPATPPAITILLSAPNTPESAVTYPSGTPSFADVLTSSALRPARTQETKSKSKPGPSFTGLTFPVQEPSNASSFADTSTPFTFSFQSPRRNGTDKDTAFMMSSSTHGTSLQPPASDEVSLSLSPKRRRLNEAGKVAIRVATPSFNGVTTSSPAERQNRRWLADEIEIVTPTRKWTHTFESTLRSMPSLSESRRGNTTYDEPEFEPMTDYDKMFDTSPSFNGVLFSPVVQRSQRRPDEETEETSFVGRSSFPHFIPGPRDGVYDLTEDEAEVGVEEQVHEDLGETGMDIEDEDNSAVHDIETEPFELRPRPASAFTSIGKNLTSEGDRVILDQQSPKPISTSINAGNSFISEGDQTNIDPEMIAEGAAEMLRLLREEMKRDREEAAREKKRAGKMRMQESQESRRARGEPINGTRRKYIGPLEALKRDASEATPLASTGGFVQDEFGSSFLSKHKPCEVSWQFSRERTIQEVERMRALVMKAYASECYDDEEIDRLTLLHLGIGSTESDG